MDFRKCPSVDIEFTIVLTRGKHSASLINVRDGADDLFGGTKE
jgi:hypothetical protein